MGNDFTPIVTLLDHALAAPLGSAMAVSIGDAGHERFRCSRGQLWRLPSPGPALTDEAFFDLASLTKPMVTAILAMIFVERGRLSLDTPLARWLVVPAGTGSVEQALGHAAGLAPHVRFFEQIAAGQLDGAATPRQALVAMASRQPLRYPAGQRNEYSDLGYILLGHVLECVGQDRLDRLFAAEVAGPLGLGAAFVDLERPGAALGAVVATEAEPDGVVVGKVHDENARSAGGIFGHAGLFGRIGDVASFARAMVRPEEGGLIGAATARRFFGSSPGRGSWRLGWDTPSATPGVSHAGDRWPRHQAVGHLGFTGTSLWLDLARQRWVALLTNRVHPSRHDSAEGIKALRRAIMDEAWQLLER
jgi:serine-type D-Ala-D-Ala carboxypeptidase